MSSSDNPKEKTSPSGGFRKTLSSLFRSPASANYNKVLAESYKKDSAEDDQKGEGTLSDEAKAKALVEQRDAASPSGSFVLGTFKPLSASQGYDNYYLAKGATGK